MATSSAQVKPVNFKFNIGNAPTYWQYHPTLDGIDPPPASDDDANAAFVQTCDKSLEEMALYPLLSSFKMHLLICEDGYKVELENEPAWVPAKLIGAPFTELAKIFCYTHFLPGPQSQYVRGLVAEMTHGFVMVVGEKRAGALAATKSFPAFWSMFPSSNVQHVDFRVAIASGRR